jgi:hypothetical protein
MKNTRRQFLTVTSAGLIGAAVAPRLGAQATAQQATPSAQPTPGAPPAFGTGPLVGPEIAPATITEAESSFKLR